PHRLGRGGHRGGGLAGTDHHGTAGTWCGGERRQERRQAELRVGGRQRGIEHPAQQRLGVDHGVSTPDDLHASYSALVSGFGGYSPMVGRPSWTRACTQRSKRSCSTASVATWSASAAGTTIAPSPSHT